MSKIKLGKTYKIKGFKGKAVEITDSSFTLINKKNEKKTFIIKDDNLGKYNGAQSQIDISKLFDPSYEKYVKIKKDKDGYTPEFVNKPFNDIIFDTFKTEKSAKKIVELFVNYYNKTYGGYDDRVNIALEKLYNDKVYEDAIEENIIKKEKPILDVIIELTEDQINNRNIIDKYDVISDIAKKYGITIISFSNDYENGKNFSLEVITPSLEDENFNNFLNELNISINDIKYFYDGDEDDFSSWINHKPDIILGKQASTNEIDLLNDPHDGDFYAFAETKQGEDKYYAKFYQDGTHYGFKFVYEPLSRLNKDLLPMYSSLDDSFKALNYFVNNCNCDLDKFLNSDFYLILTNQKVLKTQVNQTTNKNLKTNIITNYTVSPRIKINSNGKEELNYCEINVKYDKDITNPNDKGIYPVFNVYGKDSYELANKLQKSIYDLFEYKYNKNIKEFLNDKNMINYIKNILNEKLPEYKGKSVDEKVQLVKDYINNEIENNETYKNNKDIKFYIYSFNPEDCKYNFISSPNQKIKGTIKIKTIKDLASYNNLFYNDTSKLKNKNIINTSNFVQGTYDNIINFIIAFNDLNVNSESDRDKIIENLKNSKELIEL